MRSGSIPWYYHRHRSVASTAGTPRAHPARAGAAARTLAAWAGSRSPGGPARGCQSDRASPRTAETPGTSPGQSPRSGPIRRRAPRQTLTWSASRMLRRS